MKQVLIKDGKIVVEEVPVPQPEPQTALVKVEYSCISPGTEISAIKAAAQSLCGRALKNPEKLKKTFQALAKQGLNYTKNLIESKFLDLHPMGYSAAGTILEVGEGMGDLRAGLRVACAGSQCAYHAEIIKVPYNLIVLVPDNLGLDIASTVALGGIALQGVRRLMATLGETFVVLGLGVIGQIVTQILKVNGCHVIGIDLNQRRVLLAQELGLEYGIHSEEANVIEQVEQLTNGAGADGVIITAATTSDTVVSTAFKMCRKKGRVVLVGDVGLNLNREDFYQKELDFFISTSYGPGRYDRIYEEKSIDYPLAYVRWTENRNLAEYLRMVAEGKLKISPLISGTYSIEQAGLAYETLQKEEDRPPVLLFSYPQTKDDARRMRVVSNLSAKSAGSKQIRIAVIGAGNFAKTVHLPNLKALSEKFHIQAIVSRTGHNAVAVAKQFGANYSSTDYQQVLNDPEVEAVFITTRHNLHAAMALAALRAGKHVFVEKPLALTYEELNKIKDFYNSTKNDENTPILFTGFNRRFSRYALRIQEWISQRNNPMIINYRFNTGYIAPDHWFHTQEGGGGNLGEACHIYHLFTYFSGSRIISADIHAIRPSTNYYTYRDNFVATLLFEDGSVATLTYTSLGDNSYPKEYLEIFVDGKVIVLNDYRRLTMFGAKAKGIKTRIPEKGLREEIISFGRAIQEGGDWPLPLWEQIQATEIALQIESKFSLPRTK